MTLRRTTSFALALALERSSIDLISPKVDVTYARETAAKLGWKNQLRIE